jgi:pimeloyl-ACP methyl ester carboxylesterase
MGLRSATYSSPDGRRMGLPSALAHPAGGALRIIMVADPDFTGGVLVLPGGKPNSLARSRPWQLAHLRVTLLTGGLRRRLPAHIEVRRVRYRLRGWNPGRLDALRDARVALDQLLETVDGRDVVVVGHSMGARVAAHLASSGDVAAVAALAPWWPHGDGDLIPAGCRLLTMHGTADTWTDPVTAQAQTARAAARGVDAHWVPMQDAGHFLMRDFSTWHRATADFAMAQWPKHSPA